MPYRRSYRKTKSRKTRRRRSRLQVGFPSKYTCKLRYTDAITLDAPVNGVSSHAMRCNNVYDSDATGLGHQVRHYDMLQELYSHYTVLSSKITAKVVGFSNSTDDAQALGIKVGADMTLVGPNVSIPRLHEMGRTSQTRWTMVKSDAPLSTRALTQTWTQKKYRALHGATSDDVLMGSTGGAGPSKQDYFVVFASGGETGVVADDPPALRVLVTVDYVVVFTGLKANLPQD